MLLNLKDVQALQVYLILSYFDFKFYEPFLNISLVFSL